MESHVDRLVRQLDGSSEESMDARAALIFMGRDVVPEIVRGLPGLGGFGQLTAIEVFEELKDRRCIPALIDLLASDDDTVRQWFATALGGLEAVEAVEPLRRAYASCRERRTPPDWSEPESLREALTDLGALHPVVPPLVASLRSSTNGVDAVWPPDRLTDLVDDLADHGQLVLSVAFWQTGDRGTYWVGAPAVDWDFDWSAPWRELVEQTRREAWLAVIEAPTGEGIVATISWIDRSDFEV
ncbi:HEAT repeat domain-containing protein [Streptomyces sp. NPDC051555]|uniref:HEAT repeat domain-containing protein n=1 Tax=Streptomyces sp. NPDC051555 TaxID=3365657 RepID=UPI0037940238